MTATTPSKIATTTSAPPAPSVSIRDRAERLLLRVADHGEQFIDAVTDPLDVPDYLLMSLVETGRALVQLAELDAQRPPLVEIVLDGEGDLWACVGDDRFECRTGHHGDQTLEQIRRLFGVAREFVGAERPAD